ADYRVTLATALLDRSGILFALGRFGDAEESAGRAADLFRAVLDGPGRKHRYSRLFLAMAASQRAAAARERGRVDAALAAHAAAAEQFAAIQAAAGGLDDGEQHGYARALVERARTLELRRDRWPQADDDYTAAIQLWDDLAADQKDAPAYRQWRTAALAA